MATVGIRQRHGRACDGEGRCQCPWEAQAYSKRDHAKHRKQFPTRAAAVAWRDDARSAIRKGTLRPQTRVTVAEAVEAWLEGARTGLIRPRSGDAYKPSAVRAYETAWRWRIEPELGHYKLSAVTHNDVQDLVDQLVAQDLAASTIGTTVNVLRNIYRLALKRGEVAVNPTTAIEVPAVRSAGKRVAPPDECQRLLAVLPAADRPIWAAAMYGGLRRGELMALRVEDVDLAGGVIHVRRGWDTVEGEIAPKSSKGDRNVPIAGVLRDYLIERKLTLGYSEGLLFGQTATLPFSPTPLSKRATSAWKDAGLERITLHACRHTFASLMIAAGVNAKTLSVYMGHANIAITLDLYGHLFPGAEAEAAGLLDAYLARADTQARLAQIEA